MTAPTDATGPAPVRELGYTGGGQSWWGVLEAETTPELRWPLSVAVYDRMRRADAQTASVLRAVTLPIRRTQWWVEANGASEEVTRFIAEELGLPISGGEILPLPRTRGRFSWSQHLQQALLCIVYGHMFFEQVYRIGDDGRAHLRKLAPRMPSTLAAINVAGDGGLTSIEQYPAPGGTTKPVVIPVDRLVAYVHDREGGNWFGQSLLRAAYKHWLLKDRSLRTWAQTIERNGMGIPIVTDDEDNESREASLALATGIRSGANAGGYLRNGQTLELKGVTGTLPDSEKFVRYQDEQIGRSVLAHFLNLNAQGGSYALAAIQSDTFVQSLQALAEQMADTTTQHVVEDLVDLNFGPDVPAPRITFQEIGSRAAVTAEAIRALVDSGVLLREPALERWVRETYGIPDKEPLPGREPTPTPPQEAAS